MELIKNNNFFCGKVIEVKPHYAILITKSYEFYRVEKKGNMRVGQSIFFSSSDIIYTNVNKKISTSTVLKFIAAAVILSVFISINYISNLNSVYAAVSLDINPSIVFELDKNYLVLNCLSYNNEGIQLLQESYKGKDISEVINSVIELAYKENYLNDVSDTVLIASSSISNKDIDNKGNSLINNYIMKKISETQPKMNIVVIDTNKEAYENSKKLSQSIGNYELQKMRNLSDNEIIKNGSKSIDDLYEEGFFDKYKSNKNENKSNGTDPKLNVHKKEKNNKHINDDKSSSKKTNNVKHSENNEEVKKKNSSIENNNENDKENGVLIKKKNNQNGINSDNESSKDNFTIINEDIIKHKTHIGNDKDNKNERKSQPNNGKYNKSESNKNGKGR